MIIPLNNKVLIKLIKEESDIVVTNQEIKKGKVVSVAVEIKNIKKNDIVYFKNSGNIELDEYLVVDIKKIYGKISKV